MPSILVMGESGSGKTTSMRNLDPKSTYYIDCDKKGLSWRGWRSQYNAESKNYCVTDDYQMVLNLLMGINLKAAQVKTVIVDTLNGLMVADEMRRMREKNYDKWQDLAASVYAIVDYALTVRPDLTVIFIAHSQTDRDDSGYVFTRCKTSGKKLDKITIESKFTTVLLSKAVDGKHVFEIINDNSTVKIPMGAFPDGTTTIDNDITSVLKALEEF